MKRVKKAFLATAGVGIAIPSVASAAAATDDTANSTGVVVNTEVESFKGQGAPVTPSLLASPLEAGDALAQASSDESCWTTGTNHRVRGVNALGQTNYWGNQYTDWCAKNNQVTRFIRNQHPYGSTNGWVYRTQINEPQTSFPVSVARDRDTWIFRWLSSPIGSPEDSAWISTNLRANGNMDGTLGIN